MKTNIKNKIFYGNLLLVIIFFSGIIINNYCVDPFNLFSYDPTKKSVSYHNNSILWKLSEFSHNKTSNIIIGDSRVEEKRFSPELIEKLCGEKYYNFAYGGASLDEMIEIFWFATQNTKLKKVIWSMQFVHFNQRLRQNRYSAAYQLKKSKFRYLLDPITTITTFTWEMGDSKKSKNNFSKEKSKSNFSNKEKHWNFIIEKATKNYFYQYTFSQKNIKKLLLIKEYCQKNNVQLCIVVMPQHKDYIETIKKYNQQKNYELFFDFIKQLSSNVKDFSKIDAIQNKNFFRDPIHTTKDYAQELAPLIFD